MHSEVEKGRSMDTENLFLGDGWTKRTSCDDVDNPHTQTQGLDSFLI